MEYEMGWIYEGDIFMVGMAWDRGKVTWEGICTHSRR